MKKYSDDSLVNDGGYIKTEFLVKNYHIKNFVKKSINLLQRKVYLTKIETIINVRKRSPGFTELVNKINHSGTASLTNLRYSYTFEGGLRLQQNPEEFAALCIYLQENKPYINYLEIGSASGGACLFLSREVGFGNLISLDDGNHPDAVYQDEHFGQVANLRRFIGDSHSDKAETFLTQNLDGKLDVAFVDGDHSYPGVLQDIQLVLQFARPGTLIILHDTIASPGVEKAWLECVRKKMVFPLAEYIGDEVPLGIAVGKGM